MINLIQFLLITLIILGFYLVIFRPKFTWSKTKKELYNKLKLRKWTVSYEEGETAIAVSDDGMFQLTRTSSPYYRFTLVSLKEPKINLVTYGPEEGFFNPINLILNPIVKEIRKQEKLSAAPAVMDLYYTLKEIKGSPH